MNYIDKLNEIKKEIELDVELSDTNKKNAINRLESVILALANDEFKKGKLKCEELSKEQWAAIEYARACQCQWLGKNVDREVGAYVAKPEKHEPYWFSSDDNGVLTLDIDFPFLSWKDEEPMYIGD